MPPKSKRPAGKGRPITFLDVHDNARPDDRPDTCNKSMGLPVALYRCTDRGIEYAGEPVSGKSAITTLSGLLPEVFAQNPGTPKLNSKSLEHLACKLQKAVAGMQMGILADVRLVFPIGDTVGALGFHRAPVAADRHIDSILFMAMNKHGHLSERREQPSADGMELKAAAFGMQGVHYV